MIKQAASDPILLVGPSWVGDMVMAQSLFKILWNQEPGRPLDVLAPGWSLPIVERMPEVRAGIASETAHGEFGFSKRRRIAKTLAAAGYQRAVILPRSLKAALIPWFAGIPQRTGYRGESRYLLVNDVRKFDRARLDQTVKRFAALGLAPGEALTDIPSPSLCVSKERQRALVDALGLSLDRPLVAMMPGAEYGPAKCWPLDYFATLASMLEESGYGVWLMGSDKDSSAGEQIAAASKAVNLCGKTALADVIDLLALCERAVSNDSGLMHIAAAVGVHVHAIYGSSSPLFTPPLTESCDIHHLALSCSPCFERQCPLGHLRCLKEIPPASVYEKMR